MFEFRPLALEVTGRTTSTRKGFFAYKISSELYLVGNYDTVSTAFDVNEENPEKALSFVRNWKCTEKRLRKPCK